MKKPLNYSRVWDVEGRFANTEVELNDTTLFLHCRKTKSRIQTESFLFETLLLAESQFSLSDAKSTSLLSIELKSLFRGFENKFSPEQTSSSPPEQRTFL